MAATSRPVPTFFPLGRSASWGFRLVSVPPSSRYGYQPAGRQSPVRDFFLSSEMPEGRSGPGRAQSFSSDPEMLLIVKQAF